VAQIDLPWEEFAVEEEAICPIDSSV